MQRKRDDRGFTLIELLVVVSIIGVLAAIAVPAVALTKEKAQEKAAYALGVSIQEAMEAYKIDQGDYPSDFDTDTNGKQTWGEVKSTLDGYLNAGAESGDLISDDSVEVEYNYPSGNSSYQYLKVHLVNKKTLVITPSSVTQE